MKTLIFYYYTLPGGIPKALMIGVEGKTVNDVPDVFTKRYGKPKQMAGTGVGNPRHMAWISETGCAIVDIYNYDFDHSRLAIISKAGYEELFGKYLAGLKAEQDAKKKAAAEQQKAHEKALKDSL